MFKRCLLGCLFAGMFVVGFGCLPLAGVGGGFLPQAEAQGVDSYTKLMLHADGSNQVTSFTDSSSGVKTVTNTESYDSYTKLMLHIENNLTDSAAGKTVTNNNVTFSGSAYKMGGYSGVFNGSNAYLSLADSDDWDFGSGDFTIDFWVRFSSFSDYQTLFDFGQAWNGYGVVMEYSNVDSQFIIAFGSAGNTDMNFRPSWSPSLNTWYHVTLARISGVVKAFVDGKQVGTNYSYTGDITASNYGTTIGRRGDPTPHYLTGYLDELRISKGIARWTSDFTPPSSPYGKVATVTSQKKFGTASGEFKGSGEYLSLANSNDFDFGSADFTIDFWIYINGSQANDVGIINFGNTQGGPADTNWVIYFQSTTDIRFLTGGRLVGGSTEWDVNISFTGISTGTWLHLAVVRTGNDYKTFTNGVLGNTVTNSSAIQDINSSLEIGRWVRTARTEYFNGCIDELRISKGIARWTSNFTPPSSPYEVDTTAPTVSTTSPAGSATGVGVSSAISATFSEDMDSSTITTSTFTLSSSSGSVSGTVSYSNKVATFTPSSNLSYSTTYTITITTGVKDISGNAMSSAYTWSFTTSSAPDTTAPTNASISINSGASYTNSTAVTLTLSATDSVGVTAYYLSTSASTPVASASGWNSVTSATSYSGSVSYTLTTGDEQKTVYVWFKDAAGNVSSVVSDSIILDTTVPIVTITSPTSSDTYTATSSTLSPSGSASDATSGVKEVTWSSDKGSSGTASGTSYWSISSISLSTGDNKITVTAKDNAGNTSTDTITVTYSAATKPTVTTGSTSNVTATQATLTGTVNANGLSTTAWFEYGTIKGTYGSKSSTQTVTGSNDTTVSSTISGLTSGTTYYYRIVAESSAGKSEGSEMSFQYTPGGSAPTVTTDAATDVTTTTATLNGKVNANGLSTTAWFEYGAISGSYGSKSNTKAVTGSTDTTVSASISGLTAGTTYYYRIAAQNSVGTSYGKEMSFYYTSQTEAPSVTTEAATDVTATTATLNGEVNPNGQSTTVWFEYGVLSGTYKYKTSTQSKSGSSYTKVSASITGLTAGTTYYYRIAAKNSAGTSYGDEMEFYKEPGSADPTPTPTATPTVTTSPTLPPLPIPTQTGSPAPTTTPVPAGKGSISGYVKDSDENVLQGVAVSISGDGYSSSTETTNKGYYQFKNLSAGEYTLTYKEDGYETQTTTVNLKEGEAKELGTVILGDGGEGSQGKIYGFVVDIKGNPIEYVRLKLKGVRMQTSATESSDADGYFEFLDLVADTYVIVAKAKGYKKKQLKAPLEEGESKEIEFVLRKTSKKVRDKR